MCYSAAQFVSTEYIIGCLLKILMALGRALWDFLGYLRILVYWNMIVCFWVGNS